MPTLCGSIIIYTAYLILRKSKREKKKKKKKVSNALAANFHKKTTTTMLLHQFRHFFFPIMHKQTPNAPLLLHPFVL